MISGLVLPSQIFSLLNLLLNVYYFLIIARIILSWFVNSYKLEHHPLGYWLCLLTDPFLRLFRRLPFALIGGVIDISPIFALFTISLLQRFILALRSSQSAAFGMVFLSMFVQLLHLIVSMVQIAAIICALALLFRLLHALFSKQSGYNVAIGHIDSQIRKLFQGPLRFLNIDNSKFTMQIIVLFAIAALLAYLLGLAGNLLNEFLFFIQTRL